MRAGARGRPVVLATASPRRHRLFRTLGIPFRIVVPNVREAHHAGRRPQEVVQCNARLKAQAAARRMGRGVVVAADTLVVCRGRTFGKPRDARQAARMLAALSGKTHRVYTAVCVTDVDRRRACVDVAATDVTMRRLSPAFIRRFCAARCPGTKPAPTPCKTRMGC